MPRLIPAGLVTPARTDGTQSASSTHDQAASNTSGATARQCQIFDHHHSDEYVLPHFAMNWGRCCAASSVMRPASRHPVWSFQSQHCAAGFFFHFRSHASGRLLRSTGNRTRSGRVHTEADDSGRVKTAMLLRLRQRSPYTLLKTVNVIARVLPRQKMVPGVEQDALLAARIVNDTGAEFRTVSAAHDQRAHGIRSVVEAKGESHGEGKGSRECAQAPAARRTHIYLTVK